MADKQISDLTSASAMTDGSLFVIEQGGAAKSANWSMVKNYISPGVAAQYSTSATYNVGDYVIYNGQLYRCTTAISTPESWTAAHWTAAVLGDDVGALRSDLKSFVNIMPLKFNTSGKYVNVNGGKNSNGSWQVAELIPIEGNLLYIEGEFSNLGSAGWNVALYTSAQAFIRGVNIGNEAAGGVFIDVSDSNAVYLKISNLINVSVNYGFMSFDETREIIDVEKRSLPISFSVTGYIKADGTINSGATDWVSTDFIPLNEKVLLLSGRFFGLGTSGCNIAFYDKEKSFISGLSPSVNRSFIDISNMSYLRLSSHTPNLNITADAFFTKGNAEVVVDVNGGGDYTSLLAALKGTSDDTAIRLRKGVYDVISEYEAFYGSDFFTNYNGYATVSDPFYRGLWLTTGRKIRGDAGAVIRCVYTGSNTKVATLFSCISNAGNVLVENVTIEHGYLRYAIHDDFGARAGQTIEFRNIRFIGHSTGSVIGGGLGVNTNVIIDGCVFEGNRQPWDINYHGSNSAVADNTNIIRITNCRGNQGCGFWPNGPSTALSTVYVNNCKFSEITIYRPDGQDASQVMNMELIDWCNDTGS